jgi:hypothetical protein
MFMDWLLGAIAIAIAVAAIMLWLAGAIWCVAHDHPWWGLATFCAGAGMIGSLVAAVQEE